MDCFYTYGISNHIVKGKEKMEKTISNEEYIKILADGLKLSIIDLFVKQIQEIDDLYTLKKVKKELLGGVK